MQITELKDGRVKLYMSLQNRGNPSMEPVKLYVGLSTARMPSGTPALVLTDRTQGQRTALVDATLKLPAGAAGKPVDSYRIFLQVGRAVTDMMPVKGGRAVPGDPDRKAFQN